VLPTSRDISLRPAFFDLVVLRPLSPSTLAASRVSNHLCVTSVSLFSVAPPCLAPKGFAFTVIPELNVAHFPLFARRAQTLRGLPFHLTVSLSPFKVIHYFLSFFELRHLSPPTSAESWMSRFPPRCRGLNCPCSAVFCSFSWLFIIMSPLSPSLLLFLPPYLSFHAASCYSNVLLPLFYDLLSRMLPRLFLCGAPFRLPHFEF